MHSVAFNLINQNAELVKENTELKEEISRLRLELDELRTKYVNSQNVTPNEFAKNYYKERPALGGVVNEIKYKPFLIDPH